MLFLNDFQWLFRECVEYIVPYI